ncbi:hypothetical protein ACIBQ1_51335 [Nonomuraea sp. NPDC050153]|uniref:hypothetical protein n=1 Tax=Nonomuraea sp. NPDC050153 TaxID=3364359 RepID=UPI003797D7DB
MDGWVFALWGLGGGPYLVSVLGRVAASAVMAGAASASVNGMTPRIALALGAVAPLILEKLSQQIPVHADLPMAAPAAASPPVAAGAPALLQDPPSRSERLSGQTEVTGPGGGA